MTTPSNTTRNTALNTLAEAFTKMLHEEIDGLHRFNEIEAELRATPAGTPEFAALRKERTQMILQVRNSRKAQDSMKIQMLKL